MNIESDPAAQNAYMCCILCLYITTCLGFKKDGYRVYLDVGTHIAGPVTSIQLVPRARVLKKSKRPQMLQLTIWDAAAGRRPRQGDLFVPG